MTHALSRRALLLAAGAGLTQAALAQQAPAYPMAGQTVRIVVPFAAGASTDALARRIAQKLQEAWKTPVIVENKPGAGGSIATQSVMRAPADGHTVLIHTASILQYPHLWARKPYDAMQDLTPLTPIVRGQLTLAVQPDVPATSLQEFVALARANPGKYQLGNYGIGTTPHIQGSSFAAQAGIDVVQVPYQGTAPMMTALKGKHLNAAMLDVVAALMLKDQLRLLAVTGPQRWPTLPQVPTFKELGYQSLDTTGWIGLFMPTGAPHAVVQKFADEVARVVRMTDVQAQIDTMGLVPYVAAPEEFRRVVAADNEVYAKIIRDGNIRME